MLQLLGALFRRGATRRKVHRTIFGGDPTRDREDRRYPGWIFRGDDSQGIGFAADHLHCPAFGMEGIREGLLEGRLVDERGWHPYARGARRLQDFNARCHLEGAPTTKRRALRKQSLRLLQREACRNHAGVGQKIATVHRATSSARILLTRWPTDKLLLTPPLCNARARSVGTGEIRRANKLPKPLWVNVAARADTTTCSSAFVLG